MLRFISCESLSGELLETIAKLGIKPRYQQYNPVYQIIDELYYADIFKEPALNE